MLLYIASTENMIQQNFVITSTLDQPILHVISSGCDNPVTASKQPLWHENLINAQYYIWSKWNQCNPLFIQNRKICVVRLEGFGWI